VKVTVKVEGLRELDAALGNLPKATAKNVLRRILRQAAQPIADDYREGVDVQSGALRDSIGVGTQLTKRQAAAARKEGKSFVEVYAGAGDDPAAHLEEFGSRNNTPNGALRTSWDKNQERALDIVAKGLGGEIEKAAARLAKKAAKAAGA